MNIRALLQTTALTLSVSAPMVMANPILGAVSATSSIGSADAVYYQPEQLINQSGLSAHYVSGSTDFDSFVATTTHEAGPFVTNNWASPIHVYLGYLTFDLGGSAIVDRLALWNGTVGGVGAFSLLASSASDFATSTSLGSFTAAFDPSVAQVFSFAPTSASFIRLSIESYDNSRNSPATFLGEVAFRQAVSEANTVPETGSLALVGAGLMAAFLTRHRAARQA